MQEKIDNAVKNFEAARERLVKFMEDHDDVMNELHVLTSEYNFALAATKDFLRQDEVPGPMRAGAFTKSAKAKYVKYDPAKVAPEVLKVPGVIKELDYKKIDALVAAGVIDQQDVMSARTVTHGSSRISGPKEVVIKL